MSTRQARILLLLLSALGAATVRAADPLTAAAAGWFGQGVSLRPLGTNAVELAVHKALGPDNRLRGWVFRTDAIPPVVGGKRGEIGVLVGLGTDGRIAGIEVLAHREDAAWFNKLEPTFFRQFAGQPAAGGGRPPDVVTGATVSSRAIVTDVFSACAAVLALPQVRAALAPPP